MKNRTILFLAVIATHLSACTSESEPATEEREDLLGPGEVATIDGKRIPESIYRLYSLAAIQRDADSLTAEQREQIIERLITMQLLADEAERRSLDEERRIAAELALQRMQLLASHMTQRYIDENPPTESELRDLYRERLSDLEQTEYKVRHILVDTEEEAVDIIAELDQGADFATLAEARSTDTATAVEGGDLGWASPDNWVEPFANAVRAATPGETPDAPTETRFGWHVILVEDVAEEVPPGLDAVRQDLTVAAENRKLNEFVDGLRERAEVSVTPR